MIRKSKKRLNVLKRASHCLNIDISMQMTPTLFIARNMLSFLRNLRNIAKIKESTLSLGIR